MSPRKRRRSRRKEKREQEHIPWLEHRRGYPSDEEREKIIERRKQLRGELLALMVMKKGPSSPEGRELIKKYGDEEINRMLRFFPQGPRFRLTEADEAKAYRRYRLRFARFGGERPFLSRSEYQRLDDEHATLTMKRWENLLGWSEGGGEAYSAEDAKRDEERIRELTDLLFLDLELYDDLLPPSPPPRPEDYSAPPPGKYPDPVAELLEWGDDLSYKRVLEAAMADRERWRACIGDLTRMVLDPGLLDGWPSEASSWAPWHALYMLSAVDAWEVALSLADLTDHPNDWLSDLLPEVWAAMDGVEMVLWMLLDDAGAASYRRALAVHALAFLAHDDPDVYFKIADGFVSRLQAFPPEEEVLATALVVALTNLRYEKAFPAIEKAYQEGKVDETAITLDDVEIDLFAGGEGEE